MSNDDFGGRDINDPNAIWVTVVFDQGRWFTAWILEDLWISLNKDVNGIRHWSDHKYLEGFK